MDGSEKEIFATKTTSDIYVHQIMKEVLAEEYQELPSEMEVSIFDKVNHRLTPDKATFRQLTALYDEFRQLETLKKKFIEYLKATPENKFFKDEADLVRKVLGKYALIDAKIVRAMLRNLRNATVISIIEIESPPETTARSYLEDKFIIYNEPSPLGYGGAW